jgi:hypothetical protein
MTTMLRSSWAFAFGEVQVAQRIPVGVFFAGRGRRASVLRHADGVGGDGRGAGLAGRTAACLVLLEEVLTPLQSKAGGIAPP